MKLNVKPLHTATLVAVVLSFALAGCTSTTSTSTPSATSTTSNQEPARVTSPAPASTSTPAPAWNVAKDTGPTEGANGRVTKNAEGIPVRYLVASGDTAGAVCNRLHVRWWQLTSGGSFLGTYPELTVGETIDIIDVPESAAGDVESSNALC